MTTYSKKIVAEFKEMLEREYDKAKEAKSSKVREFMEERWIKFNRRGLESMLQTVDTNLS